MAMGVFHDRVDRRLAPYEQAQQHQQVQERARTEFDAEAHADSSASRKPTPRTVWINLLG